MRFPIKLLGLAGLVGATAITAIAIERRHQRLVSAGDRDVPPDRLAPEIIDAEIIGASGPNIA
jgi:hypothetical protein